MWWKRLPFFYGWVIVAVAFVCFGVGYTTWHSFSIFYVAILEEFGWSRAVTAGAFSVFTMVYGLNSMASGWLTDRFGPRRTLPLAALLLGAGLLMTTQLNSVWQFYLLFGVVAGIGLSGFGAVPIYVVLNNWFVKKRGTAGGIATAGIGVGTLLLVPFLQTIISTHGWRTAYVVLAMVTMLVIPGLIVTFYRQKPQDLGLRQDGDAPDHQPPRSRMEQVRADVLVVDREWAAREWTVGSAVRTHRFWLLWFGRLLELAVLNMLLIHQAAYLVDAGFDRLLAASVVGVVGITGSGAKIMWGMASDRIGREATYTLSCVAGTLGVWAILSIGPGSPIWMLYGYAIIYGLFYGASAVLMPVLTADIFHGRRFGSILGALYIGQGIGASTGAFLGGYVFDMTRSYVWAFSLSFPVIWLACLLYWLAAPRKVRRVAGRAWRA